MVATIVLGLVVLGVVLVALALYLLAGHARPLQRAARRLSWRADEAQQLQVKAMAVQETVADLQHRIESAQAQAAASAQKRHHPGT